jgi:hypothetical protein
MLGTHKKPREKRGQSVVANGVISDSGGSGGLRGPTRLLGHWSRQGRKRFNAALTGMGATTRVGGRGAPGPPDGKEQLCSVGGRSIWLHLECEPHYFKAIEELEGLPW